MVGSPFLLVSAPPALEGLVSCAIGVLYLTYFWVTTGRTPGKQVLGLRVVDPADRRLRVWRAGARAILCLLSPVGLLWVVVSRRNASIQDLVVRSAVAYDWAYRRGGRASAVRCRRWRLGRPGRLAQAAQPNWRLDTHVRILANCPLVCADSVRDTNLGGSAGAVDHTQSCRRHLGRRAAACTLCARLTRVNEGLTGQVMRRTKRTASIASCTRWLSPDVASPQRARPLVLRA